MPLSIRPNLVLPAVLTLFAMSTANATESPFLKAVRSSVPKAFATDLSRNQDLRVTASWRNGIGTFSLKNVGKEPVRVKEVVLADIAHGLDPATPYYGEGMTMLSQYGGTLGKPTDIGAYQDRGHYRLPEPEGFRRVYGMALLSPKNAKQNLIAFAACRRFNGMFDLSATRFRAIEDMEGLEIGAGQTWDLEPLFASEGDRRDVLLEKLTGVIGKYHRPFQYKSPPAGWCSWYCFGPEVTAKNIMDNAATMKAKYPELRFVQIDDGYQPFMGDWLESGPGFDGKPIDAVCLDIKQQGLEPAIWVAPFIAEAKSRLFRDHPDWFVKNAEGKPLDSSTVMFGGWRCAPWYVLDGTHPDARKYLTHVFKTMREKWGVTYFKLDANYWGAVRGGFFHDPKATRIEAYRRGMEAVRKGAGQDAYLLGCNHPMWASIGLIDGCRTSMDIERTWGSFASTGRENLLRSWQNGRLWWVDPDCMVQSGDVPANVRQFHATLVAATGGAMLAGDDLSTLPDDRGRVVRLLSKPIATPAGFADDQFTVGTAKLKDGSYRFFLFNWTETAADRVVDLPCEMKLIDVWTGEDLGVHKGAYVVKGLAGRSARYIEGKPTKASR